jgi:hypothetical protein
MKQGFIQNWGSGAFASANVPEPLFSKKDRVDLQ